MVLEDLEGKLNDIEYEWEEYKMKVDGLEVEIEMCEKVLEEV